MVTVSPVGKARQGRGRQGREEGRRRAALLTRQALHHPLPTRALVFCVLFLCFFFEHLRLGDVVSSYLLIFPFFIFDTPCCIFAWAHPGGGGGYSLIMCSILSGHYSSGDMGVELLLYFIFGLLLPLFFAVITSVHYAAL